MKLSSTAWTSEGPSRWHDWLCELRILKRWRYLLLCRTQSCCAFLCRPPETNGNQSAFEYLPSLGFLLPLRGHVLSLVDQYSLSHYFSLLDLSPPSSVCYVPVCVEVGQVVTPVGCITSDLLVGLVSGIYQQEIGGQGERGHTISFLFSTSSLSQPHSSGSIYVSTGIATTGGSFCKGLVFTGLQMHVFLLCPLSLCGGKSVHLLLVSGDLFIFCFLKPDLTSSPFIESVCWSHLQQILFPARTLTNINNTDKLSLWEVPACREHTLSAHPALRCTSSKPQGRRTDEVRLLL